MREPGQPGQPRQQRRADAQAGVRVVSPAAETPVAPTPPVGPTPGSTGSVPPQPSPFGREQGARVDPVQPSAELPVHRAPLAQPPHLGPRPGPSAPQRPGRGEPGPLGGHPTHPSQHQPQHPSQPPSFGQRPQRTERDVYGREHAADDRQPPPIPTPAEFHRLEQEAAEAQRRVYDAWQAQQRAQHAQAGPTPHDGVPQPIGLAAGIGQAQPSWYPDPFRRAESRWFDGRQWTASVMRGGVRGTDQPG
nr:DUF2510 domain-containing protein [Agrococcus sp. ARC_14]